MKLVPRGVFAALAVLVLAVQVITLHADPATPDTPNLDAGLAALGLRPAPPPAPGRDLIKM